MARGAWLAVVLAMWGTANFLMKVVGVRMDAGSAVIGIVIGYAIAGFTVSAIDGGRLAWSGSLIASMVIGAFYIVGNWAYVKLARTEDVSTMAPVASLNIAIPIVLGVLLLGEPLTARKLLGIFFAVVAIYLLASKT